MGREDAREGGRPEIFPYLSQSTVIAIVRPFVRSRSCLWYLLPTDYDDDDDRPRRRR